MSGLVQTRVQLRDLPENLRAIVFWAGRPVWYQHHIVYINPGVTSGISICTEQEWTARGSRPVLVVWENGALRFPTAE